MKKLLGMLCIVLCIQAVPQGTLKPKKHSRAQLRGNIFDYHCTIPHASLELQQTILNADKQLLDYSIQLLDQTEKNCAERASLDQLEEYTKALQNYEDSLSQAQQTINKAAHHLASVSLLPRTNSLK